MKKRIQAWMCEKKNTSMNVWKKEYKHECMKKRIEAWMCEVWTHIVYEYTTYEQHIKNRTHAE